jgi:hypothetical protein
VERHLRVVTGHPGVSKLKGVDHEVRAQNPIVEPNSGTLGASWGFNEAS